MFETSTLIGVLPELDIYLFLPLRKVSEAQLVENLGPLALCVYLTLLREQLTTMPVF